MPLQKSLKKAGETLREAAADLLPPMRVELLSDREAVVDGCRGILEYNECCIRLCTGALTVQALEKVLFCLRRSGVTERRQSVPLAAEG